MLLLVIIASAVIFALALELFDISAAIVEYAAAAVLAAGYLIGKKLVEKNNC